MSWGKNNVLLNCCDEITRMAIMPIMKVHFQMTVIVFDK